jgi:dTMP kinase
MRVTPLKNAEKQKTSGRGHGRFIVIDGPDGSGKTTQARLLAAELEKRGLEVLRVREPGGTDTGEAVRALLLDNRNLHITPLAETFLFQAARAQLLAEVVAPALERGVWVICDRFTLSTIVYQGIAGRVRRKLVEHLCAAATGDVRPDLSVVLWVPPQTSFSRRAPLLAKRRPDRIESKGSLFLTTVARAYQRLAERQPRKYQVVDGKGTVEAVRARIWRHVERLVP